MSLSTESPYWNFGLAAVRIAAMALAAQKSPTYAAVGAAIGATGLLKGRAHAHSHPAPDACCGTFQVLDELLSGGPLDPNAVMAMALLQRVAHLHKCLKCGNVIAFGTATTFGTWVNRLVCDECK